jgi:hypothetical protein
VLIVTGSGDQQPQNMNADVRMSEALAEQQKKAAEVLAEKLPTVKPEEVQANELATGPDRPHQPPQPLHPDRFSVGAVPPATTMKPGVAPPAETPSAENAATPQPPAKVAAKPKAPAQKAATTNDAEDASEPAPKVVKGSDNPPAKKAEAEKAPALKIDDAPKPAPAAENP